MTWPRYDGSFPVEYGANVDVTVMTAIVTNDGSVKQQKELSPVPAAGTGPGGTRWNAAVVGEWTAVAVKPSGQRGSVTLFDRAGQPSWNEPIEATDTWRLHLALSARGSVAVGTDSGADGWTSDHRHLWQVPGPVLGVVALGGAPDSATSAEFVVAKGSFPDATLCAVDRLGSFRPARTILFGVPVRAWNDPSGYTVLLVEEATGARETIVHMSLDGDADQRLIVGSTGDVLPIYGSTVVDAATTEGGGLILFGQRTDDPPGVHRQPGSALNPESWTYVLRFPAPAGRGDLTVLTKARPAG